MVEKSKSEIPWIVKRFAITLVLGILWFYFIINLIKPIMESNFIIVFTIFVILYSIFIFTSLSSGSVNIKTNSSLFSLEGIRLLLALIIAFLIFDVVMFPYLVTQEGPLQLPPEAKFSSDIYVYSLLPQALPNFIKYFITFPLLFSLGDIAIYLLVGKKQHSAIQKQYVG